ncbi:MAG: hypothetical protein ACYC6K_06865 [Bellilinea sp.]
MFTQTSSSFFKWFSIIIAPILIFVVVNIGSGIPIINQVIRKGPQSMAFLLIPLFFFTLAASRKGWLKILYTVTLLALSYGLLLKWFWTSGFSNTTHLWGILPTSDAASYYNEAFGLLSGNPVSGVASNRPIFTAFFSSILVLGNLNLKTALWILVFINVLGSLLASNEIRKTHGALAASIFLTCELLFYKPLIGTVMTEQLGFLFGNLAFACFWNGIPKKNRSTLLLGMLLLSLGLNIRAGAMFTLITLSIWIAIYLGGRKSFLKWFAVALIFAFSGFALNSFVGKSFLSGERPVFANIGHTLYGVAVGNLGWDQILKDYPGITAAETVPIAIKQIINDPLLFGKGIVNTYLDYFNPAKCWAFCFLRLQSIPITIIVLVMFLSGGLFLVKYKKQPYSLFLLFAFAGILLSVPFAPTRDVGYRSYTVTNPILITILFVWFIAVNERITRIKWKDKDLLSSTLQEQSEINLIAPIGYPLIAVIISLSFVVPMITYRMKPITPISALQKCAKNETAFSFLTNKNSWIHVTRQEDLQGDLLIPYAKLDALTKIVSASPYHNDRSYSDAVMNTEPGDSIGYAPYYFPYQATGPTYNAPLLVVNTSDLPQKTGVINICATEVTTKLEGKPYVRTFIATNLKTEMCPYQTIVPGFSYINMSGLSIIVLIVILTYDSARTIFTTTLPRADVPRQE